MAANKKGTKSSKDTTIGQPTHPLFDQKTDASVLVIFDGQDDPYQPRNWSPSKKMITIAMYASTSMGSALTSSM